MFHVLPGDLHKVGNFAVTQNENICKEMWKSKCIRSTDVVRIVGGSCYLQITVMMIRARASPHTWILQPQLKGAKVEKGECMQSR